MLYAVKLGWGRKTWDGGYIRQSAEGKIHGDVPL